MTTLPSLINFCIMSTLLLLSGLIQMSYSSTVEYGLFIRLRNFDGYLHTKYNLTSNSPVKSTAACALVCMNDPECGSFFYVDNPQKLCQTHSVLFITTNEAVVTPSTSYYQLTQARCPHEKGYILYRPVPLCYRYYPSQVSWDIANKSCDAIQNHLIDVKTAAIDNHIVSFIKASSTLRNMNASVGASLKNGSWYWSDNTPVKWTNWAKGEPNNYAHKEHCLALKDGWNDVPCYTYTIAYICQLDI